MNANVPAKPIRYIASTGNAALAVMGSLTPDKLPRNVRNNNPLNIIDTGENWMGLANPRSDGRFLRFLHPIFGYRAAARILEKYRARGVRTMHQVISTWAPPSDGNNVPKYVAFITKETGIQGNDDVFAAGGAKLMQLLQAMAIMEGAVGFDFHPIMDRAYIARGIEIASTEYAA